MTISNSFGANAAITTDAAGTEHAVWVSSGRLFHSYFDQDANEWLDASYVSDAAGGSDLQLLAGDIIPYGGTPNTNGEIVDPDGFAPGLVALWQDENGVLFYSLGRYNDSSELEWSNQVEFGDPTVNNSEQVLSQNPQAIITSTITGTAGETTFPAVAVGYEIVDTTTNFIASWRNTTETED